jgi:hypothetical protein
LPDISGGIIRHSSLVLGGIVSATTYCVPFKNAQPTL